MKDQEINMNETMPVSTASEICLKRHLGSPQTIHAKQRLELTGDENLPSDLHHKISELFENSLPPLSPVRDPIRTHGETAHHASSTGYNDRDDTFCKNELNFIPETMPVQFKSGMPLTPEELLLYASMKICFPKYTFKCHSMDKYNVIVNVLRSCCGITFRNYSIRNYFYQASNDIVRGLGKEKGILRWRWIVSIPITTQRRTQ